MGGPFYSIYEILRLIFDFPDPQNPNFDVKYVAIQKSLKNPKFSYYFFSNYFVSSNFIEKMTEFHGTFFCELLRHQSNGKKWKTFVNMENHHFRRLTGLVGIRNWLWERWCHRKYAIWLHFPDKGHLRNWSAIILLL